MKQPTIAGERTTAEPVASSKRAPGRPRSEHARQAIVQSTLRLLEETGFSDLSIEAIAADANVGKTTVYRWWPNKAALVAEAFAASADAELRFPDTGSVYSDLSYQMKQLVKILNGRRGRTVAALIGGGQSDTELIEAFRERFMIPRRRHAYITLSRGIERGELPADLDLDVALDTLYGGVFLRFLVRHQKITPEFVEQTCATVMNGMLLRKS